MGYAIAENGIIDCMNRVREPFNVNSLAQAAALASLEDKTNLRKLRRIIKQGKSYLIKNFKRMGIYFVPSATNFILVGLKQNGSLIAKKLMRKGVIVRDMSGWGLNNFIRVTVGPMKENKKFIRELRRIL